MSNIKKLVDSGNLDLALKLASISDIVDVMIDDYVPTKSFTAYQLDNRIESKHITIAFHNYYRTTSCRYIIYDSQISIPRIISLSDNKLSICAQLSMILFCIRERISIKYFMNIIDFKLLDIKYKSMILADKSLNTPYIFNMISSILLDEKNHHYTYMSDQQVINSMDGTSISISVNRHDNSISVTHNNITTQYRGRSDVQGLSMLLFDNLI